MQERRYPARTVVYWEGDPPGPAYLVASGQVWLTSTRPDGSTQFISDIRAGSLLGGPSALVRRRRTSTATTRAPMVAWEIGVDELERSVRADSILAYRMLLEAIEVVLEKDIQSVIKAGQTTKQKLAGVLLELASRDSESGTHVQVGHTELAMMIGVTRESVTRSLSVLRRQGLVATQGGSRIILIDPRALGRLAGFRNYSESPHKG
jgi:CRP-like cAMP-binding protein